MSNIIISKIDVTNPELIMCVNRIKECGKKNHIKIEKDGKYNPFYAIYDNEKRKLVGASTLDLNRKGVVNIKVLDWSNDNQNTVLTEGVKQLRDIASSEFNTDEYGLEYRKAI